MRQWLRIKWLWWKDEYRRSISRCQWCGARGASPTSLAYLERLCDRCSTAVSKSYDQGENNER